MGPQWMRCHAAETALITINDGTLTGAGQFR
jgi:hypothetical protein